MILFRTLRGRLMLLASLATLPAFLFVVYVSTVERAAALRRAEQEARYVASLASREHAQQVLGARRLLEQVASSEAVLNLQSFEETLPLVLSASPQLANLGVLDPSGDVVFSVVPMPGNVQYSDEQAFLDALKSDEVQVGRYLIGRIVDRPILIMAKALRNEAGQSHSVVFAALELAWLDQLAHQAGLPAEARLMIVDEGGSVLARSSGAMRRLAAFTDLAGHAGKMLPIEGGQLAVAVPLQGISDLWAVVAMPQSTVYAVANRIFFRDLIVLALFTLFAVAASLMATDISVLRDLRLLARATKRFGEGELGARAPDTRTGGEIRDLTVAFNTMAEALEQRQERLRALSHRLLTARDEEASRIAQELHDELGQELAIVKLELEHVRRGSAKGREEIAARIDQVEEAVDTAVASVRRISSELRPGVLDRLGLVAGLEWLFNEYERRSSIRTSLHVDGLQEPVESEISIALFRITQEALTNVSRHARATRIDAELSQRDDELTLRLRDDGIGFDIRQARRQPSLGLLGMEERALRLGGSLRIDSARGHGTCITVTIPGTRTADADSAD